VSMIYLALLALVAVLYLVDVIDPRKKIVTIPTPVFWFGALGGVVVSLQGVFDHGDDWKAKFNYWHIARPFVGAAVALIAVLIFQAGILAATGSTDQETGPASNAFYYVLAFFVGYNERAFRELMEAVGKAILRPGSQQREEDVDEDVLEEVEEVEETAPA
jgi:hypothetical protein